jgi:hypothetical protein
MKPITRTVAKKYSGICQLRAAIIPNHLDRAIAMAAERNMTIITIVLRQTMQKL